MSKAISQHEGSSRKTDLAGGKETTGDIIEKDTDCQADNDRLYDARKMNHQNFLFLVWGNKNPKYLANTWSRYLDSIRMEGERAIKIVQLPEISLSGSGTRLLKSCLSRS